MHCAAHVNDISAYQFNCTLDEMEGIRMVCVIHRPLRIHFIHIFFVSVEMPRLTGYPHTPRFRLFLLNYLLRNFFANIFKLDQFNFIAISFIEFKR